MCEVRSRNSSPTCASRRATCLQGPAAAAAEAAMPNIRIEPINWWTVDKPCQVHTSVMLKYVQPPLRRSEDRDRDRVWVRRARLSCGHRRRLSTTPRRASYRSGVGKSPSVWASFWQNGRGFPRSWLSLDKVSPLLSSDTRTATNERGATR
jgi:hypothetical protein